MPFVADLHIHSKYSRATSKQCDVVPLAHWAARKGIGVIGTGDFTHPAWRQELRDQLVPAEPGLFRLRDDLQTEVNRTLPRSCTTPVRFMLTVEISSIYKRHDRVRKVHNLVLVPDFGRAEALVGKLARIGNLGSDGRPILGLDSHDLLELTLEVGGGSFLIPAHIWTPWFSMFGAKSGFDSVEECFGDLSEHIFALETGLSSDPPMNWRLSSLDRYTLVSNSDAHSPHKLGREANLFGGELDFFAMRRALETGDGFDGTVEMFPQEGKYHADGCRTCGVRLTPEGSRSHDGRCPSCNKLITVGTLNRVEELADRPAGVTPDGAKPFVSVVPLPEVIAETVGVGPGSKKVAGIYDRLVDKLGPELFILRHAPVEEICAASGELLAEGIERMRRGDVEAAAGYDGQHGVISVLPPADERSNATAELFPELEPAPTAELPDTAVDGPTSQGDAVDGLPLFAAAAARADEAVRSGDGLDPDQLAAATAAEGPLLIIAGPGTGKTRTLTHRVACMVREREYAPEACLAVTFTRRAAGEMRQRLKRLLNGNAERVAVSTFHGLGLQILREFGERAGLSPDFRVLLPAERVTLITDALQIGDGQARRLLDKIAARRKALPGSPTTPDADLDDVVSIYARLLREHNAVDFDDLLVRSVNLLTRDLEVAQTLRQRWQWLGIDEYQDIDGLQYRLVRLIAPDSGNVTAIGDPDQAIYGFRGADVGFFLRFTEDFPAATVVRLGRNYRSNATIVDAAIQAVAPSTLVADRRLDALLDEPSRVVIHRAASDKAEAEYVAHGIEQLIGGYGFFSVDSGRVGTGDTTSFGFSDIGVLYRTAAQRTLVEEALSRAGIPFQTSDHARLGDRPGVAPLCDALLHGNGGVTVAQRVDAAASRLETPEASAAAELLLPLARRFGEDLSGFLSEVALAGDADVWDGRADRVSLMTLHAAKGLEFDIVFLVGCEDGLLPLRFRGGASDDIDEERRLFFVGMTRARRRLLLTHAGRRLHRGKVRDMSPSPFLRAIEEELLERSATPARGGGRDADRQLSLV